MGRVSVHIDRLMLRGFAPHQADAIASGLRAEIARQVSESTEGLERGRVMPRLDAGRLEIGSDVTPAEIGRRAASRAIARMRQ